MFKFFWSFIYMELFYYIGLFYFVVILLFVLCSYLYELFVIDLNLYCVEVKKFEVVLILYVCKEYVFEVL